MQNLEDGYVFGRFNPLHRGHRDLIRRSHAKCNRLFILVGSANSARTIKNPFTYAERRAEILRFIEHEDLKNVTVVPLNDYKYSDAQWLNDVNSFIESTSRGNNITIFGYKKEGNHYLDWFPQYNYVEMDAVHDISATEIRENWFKTRPGMVAPEVMEDWNYFQKEKVTFASYPYPETLGFMCGDVILECSGHILLIKRARAPGRNTWALPGGFKNTYETLLDAAIRELIEETNIRIVEKVLRGSIVSTQLFDSPSRCLGIPRVSLAVHIKIALDKDGSLPRANGKFQGEGGGEVVDVQWIPMTDIMNDIDMFDDHKDIISKMCGIMPVPAYLNPRFVELKI